MNEGWHAPMLSVSAGLIPCSKTQPTEKNLNSHCVLEASGKHDGVFCPVAISISIAQMQVRHLKIRSYSLASGEYSLLSGLPV